MRMAKLFVPLMLVHSAGSIAQDAAATAAPRVPAPSEIDSVFRDGDALQAQRSASARAANSGIKIDVSRAPHASASRLGAKQIGIINIIPALLSRPVEVNIAPDRPTIALSLPAALSRLDLTLEDKLYQLVFADDNDDASRGFRHVTMNVVNDGAAVARFTVSVDGQVYGVLRATSATYVFEPTDRPGEQVVYRYDAGGALEDVRRGLIGRSPLARRHHQLEAITEVKPDFSYSDAHGAYVVGGDLGSVRTVTPASFIRAAERLSSITQVTGAERFELVRIQQALDGVRVAVFRQVVARAAVDAVNEFAVDRSGKILRLTTSIVPEDAQPVTPLISAQEAETRVLAEWEARYGKKAGRLTFAEPLGVGYKLDRKTRVLKPSYSSNFNIEGEFSTFHARVDAVSGTVQLTELAWRNVSYESCVDLAVPGPGPGSPPGLPPIRACTAANARKGYAHPAQTGYCATPSTSAYCDQTTPKTVYEVMNDIRNTVPGAIATNAPGSTPPCCDEIVSVVVIQGSRVPNLATSTTSGRLILMPASDSNSAEILGHEMGHVYVTIYNGNVLVTDTNVFAGAVREGTADTFAGLLGAITGRTDRYGNKWVHGDGQYYPGGVDRRADAPNFQYWQDITVQAGSHASGQVISRFFRRLQEISGISDQRLLGVLVGTMAASRDIDENGEYDAGDFRRAVLSTIKSDETALRNAVHTVYSELYRADAAGPIGPPLPPGDPGPVGAPPITPSVWGSFSHCGTHNGALVSVYSVQWTPTANTDLYIGWVKMTSEPAFRYSTHVPATQTSLLLISNTTGEGRISSCNGVGCSGMSTSRVQAGHPCGQ